MFNSYKLTWKGFTSDLNANDALNLVFDFTKPQHERGELRNPYTVEANFSISNLYEISSYSIVSKRPLDYYNSTQKPSAYNPNYNTPEEFENWWRRGIEINWKNSKESQITQNPLQMLIDWSLPNIEYYTPTDKFWVKGVIDVQIASDGIANRGNLILPSKSTIPFSIVSEGLINVIYVYTKDKKPLVLDSQKFEGRAIAITNITVSSNIVLESKLRSSIIHTIGVSGNIISPTIESKAFVEHFSTTPTVQSNAQLEGQAFEAIVNLGDNVSSNIKLESSIKGSTEHLISVKGDILTETIESESSIEHAFQTIPTISSNTTFNLIQSTSIIYLGNKVEYSKGYLFEKPGQFLEAEHDNTKDPFARGNFAWLDNIVGYDVYNVNNYSRADVYYLVSSNAEIDVSPKQSTEHPDGVNAIGCVYQLSYNPKTFNDWNAWYRGRIKYGVPTAPRIEQVFEMSSRQKDIAEHKRINTILENPVYPVYLPTVKFNQRGQELNMCELQINFTHREEFKHAECIEVWLEDKVTGKPVRLDKFNKYYNNEGIYTLKEHIYYKPYTTHPWQTTKFSIPIVLPVNFNCQIVTEYRPRDRWDNFNVLRPGYTRKEPERRVLRFNPKYQTLPSYEYLNIGDHISFQPSGFTRIKSLRYSTTKQHKIIEVYQDYFKASFLNQTRLFKNKYTRNYKIVFVYEDMVKISYLNEMKLLRTKYTKQNTGQVGG